MTLIKRNGYANKDFSASLEAVAYLIKSRGMSKEDVGLNTETELKKYITEQGADLLFEDIVLGRVSSLNNYCCKKNIDAYKLAYVDLSPILPKRTIKKENILDIKNFER